MKLLENLGLVGLLLATQAWCVACAFVLLRLTQWVGLGGDTVAGRTASAAAALGGVALALWTMSLAWKRFRRV